MFLPLAVKSFLGKADMSNNAFTALCICDIIEKALVLHEQMCEYRDVVKKFVQQKSSESEYYEVIKEGAEINMTPQELQNAVAENTEETISVVFKIQGVVYDIGEPFRWRTLNHKIDELKIAINRENSKLFDVCGTLNLHEGMEYVNSKYPLDGFLESLEETRYKLMTLTGD